jgi:hypothetical protein
MKLIFLFLFFCLNISAQKSNWPVVTAELLDGFVIQAESRGIEVKQRLSTINKILFLPGAKNEHWHKNGICTITIDSNIKDDFELIFRTYHEMGHHLEVDHCPLCSYNIMAENKFGSSYFFSKQPIRRLYIDLFFEQVRDPSKPHKHY